MLLFDVDYFLKKDLLWMRLILFGNLCINLDSKELVCCILLIVMVVLVISCFIGLDIGKVVCVCLVMVWVVVCFFNWVYFDEIWISSLLFVFVFVFVVVSFVIVF